MTDNRWSAAMATDRALTEARMNYVVALRDKVSAARKNGSDVRDIRTIFEEEVVAFDLARLHIMFDLGHDEGKGLSAQDDPDAGWP